MTAEVVVAIREKSEMQPFHLVEQRGAGDCGIACAAMFLRITYEQAMALFPRFSHERGTTDCALMGAIAYHFDMHVSRTDGFCSPPGILTVPSMRRPATLHYVFWTGSRVLDPCPVADLKYRNEQLAGCVVSHIYSLSVRPEE